MTPCFLFPMLALILLFNVPLALSECMECKEVKFNSKKFVCYFLSSLLTCFHTRWMGLVHWQASTSSPILRNHVASMIQNIISPSLFFTRDGCAYISASGDPYCFETLGNDEYETRWCFFYLWTKGSSHFKKTVKKGDIVPFCWPPPLNGLKGDICCLITDKSA